MSGSSPCLSTMSVHSQYSKTQKSAYYELFCNLEMQFPYKSDSNEGKKDIDECIEAYTVRTPSPLDVERQLTSIEY